jgi:GLPGLI family protein
MYYTFVLIFCCFTAVTHARSQYQVDYLRYSNNKIVENQDTIFLSTGEHGVVLATKKLAKSTMSYPYEFSWFNPKKLGHIHQVTHLNSNESIAMVDSTSYKKQVFEITQETKNILGYTCKKAITKINSNTITLWFTNELGVYGGPTSLGGHLGLVLEYDRNGTYAIRVSKLTKLKKNHGSMIGQYASVAYYSPLDYRDLVWKSRFKEISVFKKHIINFDPDHIQNDLELSVRFANGTLAAKRVTFPDIPSGHHLFVDAQIQSNGDAYDRTASILAMPTEGKKTFFEFISEGNVLPVFVNGNGKEYQGVVSTETYQAPLELMRMFTSFGIKHFNHLEIKDKNWHEEVPFRQDITELSPIFSGKEMWIVLFIGNYDKGGHVVDLNFTIHEAATKVFPSKQVIPLFNTTNIMEMAGQEYATMFSAPEGLFMTFTLEKPIKNAYLRYIATGHGGWENGDEFLPKRNSIELNNTILHQFIPWRQDCGSFRLYNPASGNFGNGLSSSDYSRSNWCPGTVTNPEFIFIGDLQAGEHTIRVRIPMGEQEGSSFSAWNVSGVIFGE